MAFGEMSFIDPEAGDDYEKAWRALGRAYGHDVSAHLLKPEFKKSLLMGKILCRPENVIGKAQRSIKSVDDVPYKIVSRPEKPK
jgi:hypothetical protein